jgi:hypothetical protein
MRATRDVRDWYDQRHHNASMRRYRWRMKRIDRRTFTTAPIVSCSWSASGPDATWQGFVLPVVPSVEVPDACLLEQTVERIMREALSVGLTLRQVEEQIHHALAAVGLTLSTDELAIHVSAGARTYA